MDRKVLLITGARKGIGRYLADYYIEKGYFVIGCSRNKVDKIYQQYEHYEVDVTDEKSVKKMFSSIRKKYGSLDVLINNAGIASMNHTILTTASLATRIVMVNFLGTFLFCREAAKLMKGNNSGRIVNFSSVAVPLKIEGEAVYASSKAAVVSFTEILAKELSPFKITVNAIGPTPVKTDLIKAVPEEKIVELLKRQSIHRLGEMKDISNVIDFFISDKSDFVTGQTIYLGGV